MAEFSRLNPLLERQYVVFGFGADEWVPMRVVRRKFMTFPYTFAKDISGFNGGTAGSWQNLLGGASEMPVLANAPSQSTVTAQFLNYQAQAGVTDLLKVTTEYEVIEGWYGIMPSVVRVWKNQPPAYPTDTLDQGLAPLLLSGQGIDIGGITGFESPEDNPADETAFYSLYGVEIALTLANPVPEQVSPRLLFVLNKLLVTTKIDPSRVLEIFRGRQPARWVTIGDPIGGRVQWTGAGYGGVQGLPLNLDEMDTDAALKLIAGAGFGEAAA